LCGKDPKQVAREIDDELIANGIASYVVHNVRKDGTPFWCRGRTSTFEHPEHGTIWVAVHEDITDRRRAEESLRESEEGQRALFESAPDPIVVTDAEGRIGRVNRQAEVMFGYQRSELIGQPVEMLIPQQFRGRHERHRAGYVRSPHLRPMGAGLQLYGRRKDNSEFPVDIMLSPLASKRGTLVIAVVRDVTERKRTEQALRQLSVSLLRSQDKERRRIARELHDSTGQKMAALAMNLSLIGKSVETLDSRARKALTESLALLDQSACDIRTLSYLLHPPMLDERGLAAAVRWFTDGFTRRSGVRVKLEVPADLHRLPEEIEMALFRIVQEGLTNTHRHSGSSTASIRLAVDQDHVQLEVRDAGKGLPKPRSDGYVAPLGVGITGMHERVKQLGGQMKIDSDSRGTTVSVTLPLPKAAS
jgi:PAS domain S-box-containing protein